MDITITIPDDAASTCAAFDGKGDPVAFLTAQAQEITDLNVQQAQRRKTDFALDALGVVQPQNLPTDTATSLLAMLTADQPVLVAQVAEKQAALDTLQAAVDAAGVSAQVDAAKSAAGTISAQPSGVKLP